MKKSLFKYVHEILAQKELIIVPNFGAFVLQKTTTFLNDGEYISIIFSAQQQNDDGALSKHISIQNNCSEEDADEFIESSLEEIYNTINSTGTYTVEGIGEFRAINERIVFKPFDDQFLLKTEEESIELIAETTPIIEEEKPVIEIPEKKVERESPVVTEKQSEKIDIDTIRQTYAERSAANNATADKSNTTEPITAPAAEPANESIPKIKKENKPLDYSKVKAPFIIIIVLALFGILGYFFRNEIASLNKPAVTNDTTQVIMEQGMEQLADTLNEIQNSQNNEVSNEQTPINSPEEPATQTSNSNVTDNSRVTYGNNTVTMYYVTKASFLTKQDANVEEKNLDYTGFEASVLETDGTKKYHVVIAEFSDIQLAKQELAFAKEIDNSFYLMTVKPRK